MAAASSTPAKRRYSARLPRAERRAQLLDAALDVIARDGFDGLSMEGVAREAEISKTVVYEAFGTRGELLRALLEREQGRMLAAIAAAMPTLPLSGEPGEILATSLARVLEEVRHHPDAWRLILLPADGIPPSVRDDVQRHRELLVGQITPMVEWGLRELGLAGLDVELAAQLVLGSAENAVRLVITHPDEFTPERMARFASDLVAAIPRAG